MVQERFDRRILLFALAVAAVLYFSGAFDSGDPTGMVVAEDGELSAATGFFSHIGANARRLINPKPRLNQAQQAALFKGGKRTGKLQRPKLKPCKTDVDCSKEGKTCRFAVKTSKYKKGKRTVRVKRFVSKGKSAKLACRSKLGNKSPCDRASQCREGYACTKKKCVKNKAAPAAKPDCVKLLAKQKYYCEKKKSASKCGAAKKDAEKNGCSVPAPVVVKEKALCVDHDAHKGGLVEQALEASKVTIVGETYPDQCDGREGREDFVQERLCNNNMVSFDIYDCKKVGKTCKNGACVEKEQKEQVAEEQPAVTGQAAEVPAAESPGEVPEANEVPVEAAAGEPIVGAGGEGAGGPAGSSCTDSEEEQGVQAEYGKIYTAPAGVTTGIGGQGGSVVTLTDECTNGNTLREFYCTRSINGNSYVSDEEDHVCGDGNVCQDGACVVAPQVSDSCVVTDTGITNVTHNGVSSDMANVCIGDFSEKRYSCNGVQGISSLNSCVYGFSCQDGACCQPQSVVACDGNTWGNTTTNSCTQQQTVKTVDCTNFPIPVTRAEVYRGKSLFYRNKTIAGTCHQAGCIPSCGYTLCRSPAGGYYPVDHYRVYPLADGCPDEGGWEVVSAGVACEPEAESQGPRCENGQVVPQSRVCQATGENDPETGSPLGHFSSYRCTNGELNENWGRDCGVGCNAEGTTCALSDSVSITCDGNTAVHRNQSRATQLEYISRINCDVPIQFWHRGSQSVPGKCVADNGCLACGFKACRHRENGITFVNPGQNCPYQAETIVEEVQCGDNEAPVADAPPAGALVAVPEGSGSTKTALFFALAIAAVGLYFHRTKQE